MKAMLVTSVIVLLTVSYTHADPLKAGAAKIDITPPIGHPMWGYGARRDLPSVGVRDPLHARALVLKTDKNILAIVSLDLGRAPTRQSMANIRKALKDATGIETIFVVGSHTHHGPVLELDNWPKEKPYVRTLEEKIVEVIAEANKKLEPARMGISSHQVPFNRNRHSKRADPPVDREMLIVRIETSLPLSPKEGEKGGGGRPIAHLVNFAAHPTMLPAQLREFSPDYPGFLCGHVEKELGGLCLFLQGASGDLSPNPPGERTPEKFGQDVGTFVVDKSRKMMCDRGEIKKMMFSERDFRFTSRIDISNPFVLAAYSVAFFPALVQFYEREYREGVRPHLTTVLLDDRIGLVGVSGEFFSSHAIQLKRRARLDHLLFLGYCNDYQQYFPTIEAVAEGGYGADPTVNAAEIGAGERVMDQALIELLQMQGKIQAPRK
jgi:hypothetical protein